MPPRVQVHWPAETLRPETGICPYALSFAASLPRVGDALIWRKQSVGGEGRNRLKMLPSDFQGHREQLPIGVAVEISFRWPLARRTGPAIPRRRRVLRQRLSAVRPSSRGQWRPAHGAARPDSRRRNVGQRGQGWGSSAGPGRAQLRGIGRAVRARGCPIVAFGNTSRPGSPTAAPAMGSGGAQAPALLPAMRGRSS
jgi:hypothetical protein